MALIVFFRGINVGGHRNFRPGLLAKELAVYDVVSVGAGGTLIVGNAGPRAKFIAELRRKLPLKAEIAYCDGRDLLRLETENSFGPEPPRQDLVPFISNLSETSRRQVSLPVALPDDKEPLVQVIGRRDRLVFGLYRRHMKTIACLGQIDQLFGVPATTRSWTTIRSVLRILTKRQ